MWSLAAGATRTLNDRELNAQRRLSDTAWMRSSHTDAAAGNGAGEQGRGRAARPTRHKARRRVAAGWRPRAILLSHATPSVFH
jgi:hypothetical protein